MELDILEIVALEQLSSTLRNTLCLVFYSMTNVKLKDNLWQLLYGMFINLALNSFTFGLSF